MCDGDSLVWKMFWENHCWWYKCLIENRKTARFCSKWQPHRNINTFLGYITFPWNSWNSSQKSIFFNFENSHLMWNHKSTSLSTIDYKASYKVSRLLDLQRTDLWKEKYQSNYTYIMRNTAGDKDFWSLFKPSTTFSSLLLVFKLPTE